MSTKRQHYVFQSYLKGFSIDNLKTEKMVWAYDKDHCFNKAPTRPKSIRSICYGINYYAQKAEGDEIIENKFRDLENIVSPIIKSLDLSEKKRITLKMEEKAALAFIIGLSFTRVPNFRDGIEAILKQIVEKVSNNIELDLPGPEGESFAEFREKIGGFKIEIEHFASLKPMILSAQQIGESILKKNWVFISATDEQKYLTSDNPVTHTYSHEVFGYNPNVGPAHTLSNINFPLRKDVALICTPLHKDGLVTKGDPNFIRHFNRQTAISARKYVIADTNSDALARMITKLKGTESGLKTV